MATENSRKRRRYGAELKAQILAECDEPGASVAKVAMAHGINANIVHGWRKLAREAGPVAVTEQFVPVAVAPAVPRPVDERANEVELRRGAIAVKLSWPMSAALDLSAWMADALHQWMRQQRQKIPDGSATARAIDYSLNRWAALTRFLHDDDLPIDNNWVENRIRPLALGRQNWLFAGSLRARKRAAAVMSLIHSAKLNGLDPYAYVRDVLERLPTQPASRITELLPHHWQPITSA